MLIFFYNKTRDIKDGVMRKILIIVGVLFFLCSSGFGQNAVRTDSATGEVNFLKASDWEQVLIKAKKESKYIFVDVYATWCGPCKLMDRDVYSNSQVIGEMKDKFIAIKVQADSSQQDDFETRKGYKSAQEIVRRFNVTGYPTLLFFSPDGRLLEQELGYRRVGVFITLLRQAIDPMTVEMYDKLDAYKAGLRNYASMGKLALFVKKIIRDKGLADSIALDYRSHFLSKQSTGDLCTRDNIEFFDQFTDNILSTDSFFVLCYNRPGLVDSVKGLKGWAMWRVRQAITRENLSIPFVRNGHPLVKSPDWREVERAIGEKYPMVDAKLLVLQFKIKYYRSVDLSWKLWSECIEEKLAKYPPEPKASMAVFDQLNMPAWDVFQYCADQGILQQALRWSELSIKVNSFGPGELLQYLDTRANLLYKLGRRAEAIIQEQSAIETSKEFARKQGQEKVPFIDEFMATLDKMEKKLPTWPIN